MSDLPTVVDEHIKRVEGGFQRDAADPGNWTGGKVGEGELVGTKYGISAAANPDVDIVNLTWEQAEDLYFARYWKPSGSEGLWLAGKRGLALVTMDAALHSGVSRGAGWTRAANGDPLQAVAARLRYLTNLDTLWPKYHRGWTRRVSSLMSTAASLEAPPSGREVADVLVDNRGGLARVLTSFSGTWGPVAYHVRPLANGEGTKLDVDHG